MVTGRAHWTACETGLGNRHAGGAPVDPSDSNRKQIRGSLAACHAHSTNELHRQRLGGGPGRNRSHGVRNLQMPGRTGNPPWLPKPRRAAALERCGPPGMKCPDYGGSKNGGCGEGPTPRLRKRLPDGNADSAPARTSRGALRRSTDHAATGHPTRLTPMRQRNATLLTLLPPPTEVGLDPYGTHRGRRVRASEHLRAADARTTDSPTARPGRPRGRPSMNAEFSSSTAASASGADLLPNTAGCAERPLVPPGRLHGDHRASSGG